MTRYHPANLEQLTAALASGERSFPGLRLGDLDGVDLDLAERDLIGGCFREARFGRASLRNATVQDCRFQQALLWGADLRERCLYGANLSNADLQDAARLDGDLLPSP